MLKLLGVESIAEGGAGVLAPGSIDQKRGVEIIDDSWDDFGEL